LNLDDSITRILYIQVSTRNQILLVFFLDFLETFCFSLSLQIANRIRSSHSSISAWTRTPCKHDSQYAFSEHRTIQARSPPSSAQKGAVMGTQSYIRLVLFENHTDYPGTTYRHSMLLFNSKLLDYLHPLELLKLIHSRRTRHPLPPDP
jgi:hypothetical protein